MLVCVYVCIAMVAVTACCSCPYTCHPTRMSQAYMHMYACMYVCMYGYGHYHTYVYQLPVRDTRMYVCIYVCMWMYMYICACHKNTWQLTTSAPTAIHDIIHKFSSNIGHKT